MLLVINVGVEYIWLFTKMLWIYCQWVFCAVHTFFYNFFKPDIFGYSENRHSPLIVYITFHSD